MTGGNAMLATRRRKRNYSFDKISFFAVFLGLPLVIYLLFVVSPFVQAFYYSLTSWNGFTPDLPFVGLDNYKRLLDDDTFKTALMNNLVFLVVLPLVTIAIALVLASLVTVGGSSKGNIKGIRGSSFYRVVSFFPYVVPAIVIGIIWYYIYAPNGGLLNGIIGVFGLGPVNWLGGEGWVAKVALIATIVWGFVGFYMVLFVAGIKGIPAEIFEAARIDGAGRLRSMLSITIPLIRDNIQTAVVYMGILALDAFVYVQALTSEGGPDNSTQVVANVLFNTAFTKGDFGYACAMGVVLAVVTLVFAGIIFGAVRIFAGKKDVTL